MARLSSNNSIAPIPPNLKTQPLPVGFFSDPLVLGHLFFSPFSLFHRGGRKSGDNQPLFYRIGSQRGRVVQIEFFHQI